MALHEEFLELCAAATAGELSPDEQGKLDAHLVVCDDCRRALRDYENASQHAVAAVAAEFSPAEAKADGFWSVEKAERELFKRLDAEKDSATEDQSEDAKQGQRFAY